MAAIGLFDLRRLHQEHSSLIAEGHLLQDRLDQQRPEKNLARLGAPALGHSLQNISANSSLSNVVDQLVKCAAGHDLVFLEAQYTHQKPGSLNLGYYEIRLPLHGNYTSLRAFLVDIGTTPNLTIVGLELARPLVTDERLAAQIRLRLHLPE